MSGRTVVFDIEADGLLDKLTKLHCISAIDVDTREEFFWDPTGLEEGLKFLEGCGRLIAHNGLDYDCRAIEQLYPQWKRPPVWDTLIFCKMVWPADILVDRDFRLAKLGKMPMQMIKRQSIEAWGYRLGVHKVGADITDWSTYTPYMGERNRSDVKVNLALWDRIVWRIGWKADKLPEDGFVWSEECFELEHEANQILLEQTRAGFKFDKQAAIRLAADLTTAQQEHAEKLKEVFGGWWQPLCDPHTGQRPARKTQQKMGWLPDVTMRRFSEKTGKELKAYVGPPLMEMSPEAPYTPIEWTEFNPSSRQHLGMRLMAKYGWKPSAFGGKNNNQPVVDEGTISDIPTSILPEEVKGHILDYFVVTKTLGQLSVGRQSWLGKCGDDGRIHGRVDALGAITARATHKDPNLGQVPAVSVKETKDANGKIIDKKPILGLDGGFGWECRSLFISDDELTGTDASGLELRGLGHHLAPYDGGAFLRRVSDPTLDIHEEHSKLTLLSRASTKTTTYAYIYGAGGWKIGVGVGYSEEEVEGLLASPKLKQYLQYLRKRQGAAYQEPSKEDKCYIAKGFEVIDKFEAGITGIKKLKKALAEEAAAGWVRGLDGRKIYIRKAHAALNTVLQSDGAIICKKWMVEFHKRMSAKLEVLAEEPWWRQVAWVHDELQIEHAKGLGKLIAATSQEAMNAAEKAFGYRCPLATSAATGRTWAETH